MRIFIGSMKPVHFYVVQAIALDNAMANLAFSLYVLWEVTMFFLFSGSVYIFFHILLY